jgi:hypothetical protein
MSVADLQNPSAPSPTLDLRDDARLPLTALSIVDAAGTDVARRLAAIGALNESSTELIGVRSSLWSGAQDELAQMARGVLNFDLGPVLVAGLLKIKELIEAGRTTHGTLESVVVDLAGHQLSLARHPSVDVVLMDQVVASVPFALQVDLNVKALAGTVRNALLVGLTSGAVEAVVTFGACGAELATARRTFDPHVHVSLANGLPIRFAGDARRG